ncbi:MAG: c-type cytochrome [Nitrospinae bacterium]|nr:c-type cytochrome [Nitrospinota bacterium]
MQTRAPSPGVSKVAVWVVLTSLVVVLGSASALGGTRGGSRGDPLVGRKLYMTHCFTCHGVTGKGDGPAAASLEPKPRNLTDDTYMSGKIDQDLGNAISGGSVALHRFSAMPEWKQLLYPERIRDLIAYIRTLHRPPASIDRPLARQGNSEAGKRLFADSCAICHGKEGRGDGPAAAMFGPKPFDFTDKAGMTAKRDQDLYFAIFAGGEAIGKSAFMPRWAGVLREQDIWDVIAYVRTFSRP